MIPSEIELGGDNFLVTDAFKYLRAHINDESATGEEVRSRVAAGKRSYFSLLRILKSRAVNRGSEVRTYYMLE